jgi:transaldolase/transaldolase/glucose-6-phosphate isomerase
MNAVSTLKRIRSLGQSIWLDFIERRILEDGTLSQLINDDGLGGLTSNPAIFEKAIAHTDDYQDAIREMARRHAAPEEIYERLTIYDIKKGADLFRPVFDATGGGDGYVSLEVSPHIARDTERTVAEAKRLWNLVDRPNLMIKVPGTREGLPAIRELIRQGINVNVTLLFSVSRYGEVIDAYMDGLAQRRADGNPVNDVASVASFFLSRIDTMVDPMLDDIAANSPAHAATALELRGHTAIASAGAAYRLFLDRQASSEWATLADQGARKQRLLWASTSTKDPTYSDVKYIEALIGPDTVNTVPVETLAAYRDHGLPEARLHTAVEAAAGILSRLAATGIDLAEVDQRLEDEGVRKFEQPYEQLLKTLGGLLN